MATHQPGRLPAGIFGHNRAVVTAQYAVMPAEGVLASRLPNFAGTTARILTAPPMGARFAQILLEIDSGGGTVSPIDDGLEHFVYLLEGALELGIDDTVHHLAPHGYAYVPAGHAFHLRANGDVDAGTRLLWIKRPYEPIDLPAPPPLVDRRDDVERSTSHTEGRYWQYLLGSGDLAFDFEVNILGFQPGVYFPYVETHVMEHGLYMLEGQLLYELAGDQHEVWETDFIWMAPYCPQFCFCTGWGEAAYLLYKDVNRDIRF
ncbi:MAG TPA: (S)-ureidoglycine aminohydrolase [Thermomicrobiaceae bacterium]|nr:(S)-ureidoglycine aminohydrolase [Thermomicrobiaceae bacterium]